jgi:hypothetical protein
MSTRKAGVAPSAAALVALGALAPVAAYMLLHPAPVVALSLVSVVLIAACVYSLFGGTGPA